jgi:hypothetical protein
MADISMCPGTNCDVKENCYRYLATPDDYRQAWFGMMPYPPGEECVYYWPVESEGHGHD